MEQRFSHKLPVDAVGSRSSLRAPRGRPGSLGVPGTPAKTEGSGLHGVLTLHLTLRLRVKGSGVVQGGPRVGRGGWVMRADPHGRAPQLLQFTEPLGKGQTPGLGLII